MSLPATPSAKPEQYSMVLSSASYADSPAEALAMFFAQMASGNVVVEIRNEETGEGWDLDDLGDQNGRDQVDLALGLLVRHLGASSGHERIALLDRIATSIGASLG